MRSAGYYERMSKNHYPKHNVIRNTVGVLCAGSLAIALSGCGESTTDARPSTTPATTALIETQTSPAVPLPITSESFVDCKSRPSGTVSVEAKPGQEGIALFGDGFRGSDNKIVWAKQLELHKQPESARVWMDGTSSPDAKFNYSDIPEADRVTKVLELKRITIKDGKQTQATQAYVDATSNESYDTESPLSSSNTLTFTYHCVPPDAPMPAPAPSTGSTI